MMTKWGIWPVRQIIYKHVNFLEKEVESSALNQEESWVSPKVIVIGDTSVIPIGKILFIDSRESRLTACNFWKYYISDSAQALRKSGNSS